MRLPEFRMVSVFGFSVAAAGFIGLMNLYSAAVGQEHYFVRQLAATAVGAGLCVMLAAVDYHVIRRFSFALYALGCAVLLLTAVAGHEVKATRAWISLGFFSIQPSELFKGVFILHLASYLGKIQKQRRATLTRGLLWPTVLVGIPIGLILFQHDAGTAAVFIPVFFVMLYMADLHFSLIGFTLAIGAVAGGTAALRVFGRSARPDWEPFLQTWLSFPYALALFGTAIVICLLVLALRLRATHFRGGGVLKFVTVILLILFVGTQAGEAFYRKLKPHQRTRIASFFQPQVDPRGAGYQSLQAQIAVGSGGIFGKGYLKGTQKRLGFLPEQWTDFAFAVLAEEWGFAGSAATLLIYAMLIGSAVWIGRHASDLYGSLLATGTATLLFVHMSVGVAMNIGSFPVVGIPMPFLSYGGSAQVLNFAMAGLVMSVARHRRLLTA